MKRKPAVHPMTRETCARLHRELSPAQYGAMMSDALELERTPTLRALARMGYTHYQDNRFWSFTPLGRRFRVALRKRADELAAEYDRACKGAA